MDSECLCSIGTTPRRSRAMFQSTRFPPTTGVEKYPSWYGCLSPRPITFKNCGNLMVSDIGWHRPEETGDFQLTNDGLRISLHVLEFMEPDFKLVVFNVTHEETIGMLAVCMQPLLSRGPDHLARSRIPNRLLSIPGNWTVGSEAQTVYLHHERDPNKPERSKGHIVYNISDIFRMAGKLQLTHDCRCPTSCPRKIRRTLAFFRYTPVNMPDSISETKPNRGDGGRGKAARTVRFTV